MTGPNAEQAKAAALDMVGGGTAAEIELQDGDGAGVYEVEVLKDDGPRSRSMWAEASSPSTRQPTTTGPARTSRARLNLTTTKQSPVA